MNRKRNGYTMMEVVLVCAILMAVAAVSVPVMSSMMGGSKLDDAKDAVSAVMSEGRTLAIREGRAYRLEIKNNSNEYRLVVDEEQNLPEGEEIPTPRIQTLPQDVFFCCDEAGGDWTEMITFQCDGTGLNDKQIKFRMQKSLAVVVNFRAATGRVESIGWEGEDTTVLSTDSAF